MSFSITSSNFEKSYTINVTCWAFINFMYNIEVSWRLALASELFTVSPILSQGLFPWLVANKCHFSTANKYSSSGRHEQKNKKTTGQIKFLAVTIKQQIKLVLHHSLCKWINVLVQVLPFHSFIYSISCLVN